MAEARPDMGDANPTVAEQEVPGRAASTSPVLRRATAADVPVLARMLARSFFDDPVAMWACPPDALRPKALEGFYVARLNQLLAHEDTWTTSELECAALWAPPERWKTTPREDLELMRGLLQPRVFWRLPLVTLGLLGAERRHPEDPPHWYLAVLGTDPPAQGRGLGSSVLGPILERCDADGLGAYLESSKERNINFYARHGFRVTGELYLPRGPTVWLMWRDPQPG